MSATDFKEIMLKLKAHYSLDAQQRPSRRAHPLPTGTVRVEELQATQAAVNDYQGALNANNGTRERGMTNGVSDYQHTKNTQLFENKMNELRQKDRQRREE